MNTSSTTERTTPVSITCPPWCTVSAKDHADDLTHTNGVVVHHAARGPAGTTFSVLSNPEGHEIAAPTFYVEGWGLSLEQALALTDAVRRYMGETNS